jgi:hypothetical protein
MLCSSRNIFIRRSSSSRLTGDCLVPPCIGRAGAFPLRARSLAFCCALAAGVPAYLFPENEKITSFYEDASAEAEAAGLPLPCRLLFDSSAKIPPIEAKKEDILRVKALLLERNGLFCPIKKK